MTSEFTRAYARHENEHCNNCGVRWPYHSVTCPWTSRPTAEERAAWFAEHRTSVAEMVDRMTLRRWLFEWARTVGVIACVGIDAVARFVKGIRK